MIQSKEKSVCTLFSSPLLSLSLGYLISVLKVANFFFFFFGEYQRSNLGPAKGTSFVPISHPSTGSILYLDFLEMGLFIDLSVDGSLLKQSLLLAVSFCWLMMNCSISLLWTVYGVLVTALSNGFASKFDFDLLLLGWGLVTGGV